MAFCVECGGELVETQKFCGSCGSPLLRKESTEPLDSKSLPAEADGAQVEAQFKLWQSPIGMSLVAFFIAIVAGLFLWVSSIQGEPDQNAADSSSSSSNVIDFDACLAQSSHGALAGDTSSTTQEMTSEVNLATDIGTLPALTEMATRLSTTYASRFISLGQRWTSLTDCGDSTLGGFTSSIGSDLTSVGLTLQQVSPTNTEPLTEAGRLLKVIADKSGKLAEYLLSLI